MDNRKEIVEQTRLAFEFIQKLYLETSYLIKEIEGQLAQEDEEFIIGHPGGYAINTRSSTGLEPQNVAKWLMRSLSVFFIPKKDTKFVGGSTYTNMEMNKVILFLRIVLDGESLGQPTLYSGILYNFEKGQAEKAPERIERIMRHIEYHADKIFSKLGLVEFESAKVKFTGRFFSLPLYEIESSKEIHEKIITPALQLFREQVTLMGGSNA